jgi:hypothetical protein
VNKPVMLDLFCGAGGATRGYQQSGFYVVGVDIRHQPDYCGDRFYCGDALSLVNRLIREYGPVFIHASPPCQSFSNITPKHVRGSYPNLIPATRHLLLSSGLPYVIENVPSAPLENSITLCGEMFNLRVIRHRKFEIGGGIKIAQPEHYPHRGRTVGAGGASRGTYTRAMDIEKSGFYYYGVYGNTHGSSEWSRVMEMPWVTDQHSIAEAIPPAYTRFIGHSIFNRVTRARKIPPGGEPT